MSTKQNCANMVSMNYIEKSRILWTNSEVILAPKKCPYRPGHLSQSTYLHYKDAYLSARDQVVLLISGQLDCSYDSAKGGARGALARDGGTNPLDMNLLCSFSNFKSIQFTEQHLNFWQTARGEYFTILLSLKHHWMEVLQKYYSHSP